jgi:hypothetical protein
LQKKEGRILNPEILEISVDVIFQKETKFANRNATKNGVEINGTIENFKTINFSIFKNKYLDLNLNEKDFYQAEVLVLEKVPLKKIINIENTDIIFGSRQFKKIVTFNR